MTDTRIVTTRYRYKRPPRKRAQTAARRRWTARDLAMARHDAQTGQQAAAELRQARGRTEGEGGRLHRAWAGWRGR